MLVQLVRIPACHAGGHGFESHTYRKKMKMEDKNKTLKIKTEINSLEGVLKKLEEKYKTYPQKHLSDVIVHLAMAIDSAKQL